MDQVRNTTASFQDIWTNKGHENHLKIINVASLQNGQKTPFEGIDTLISQIRPVGWLRKHFANSSRAGVAVHREARARSSAKEQDGIDSKNEDSDASDASKDEIGQPPYYGFKGDELAWHHIQRALKVAEEPMDMPSRYTDETLDPLRMRSAMGASWSGLKPFQKDGVGRLVAAEKGWRGTANGALLADSMGMGKTVQMIATFESNPTDRANIFILPASLFDNWQEELCKFLKPKANILIYDGTQSLEDFRSYDIVFVTYERLRNEYMAIERFWMEMRWRQWKPYPNPAFQVKGQKRPKKLPISFKRPRFPLFRFQWARAMFEEAQILRNHKTPTLRACHTLDAKIRDLLTGTPLTNEYGDIHSILRVLRVPPFDDFEWFKAHFLRKPPKGSDAVAWGKRVRENEIPPLDVTRNAFLFLAILGESIRRTRDGWFDGEPLSKGLPKLQEFNIHLDLDDGRRYNKIFKYAMQDIPAGCNTDAAQLKERVDDFFAFIESDGEPKRYDGATYMKHVDMFYPRTERETQLKTKKQWSNKLRDAIKYDVDAEIINEDDVRVAEGYSDRLLADMGEGRLAGAHWAVPGAKYGATIPDDFENEESQMDDGKCRDAREKFKKWLRGGHGNRWRSTKMDWIVNKVETDFKADDGHCFIIACYSLAVLDVVEAALEAHKIKVLRFDGSMKPHERSHARIKFQERAPGTPRVLLLTSASGGAGLNLTAANRVVIVIPEWAKATENQIMSRPWREGQTRKVEVYHLLASNSMDLRLVEKQTTKQTKGFGILDLYTLDLDVLSPSDRMLVERTREKVEEMKTWTESEFSTQLTMIFVIDREEKKREKPAVVFSLISSEDEG